MTKSDRIRALIAQGRHNLEIARETGISDAYIRAVRQRTGPDGKARPSRADILYNLLRPQSPAMHKYYAAAAARSAA